jgi:hypothetical protein
MIFCRLVGSSLLLICSLAIARSQDPPGSEDALAQPKQRTFRFTYAAKISDLPAGKVVRIWLPVPPSSEEQQVKIITKQMPGPDRISREPKYQNQILFVEAKAPDTGVVSVSVTYLATRRELSGELNPKADDIKPNLYLQPDARVPVGGKPLELIQGKEIPQDQTAAAQMLFDVVNRHMRYAKTGTGWGRGDATWACTSGYGNCSDFHSLFISLARSLKIPAKFEIGFLLPDQRGKGELAGYHCWAKFRPAGKNWIPVDISEANKHPALRNYYFGHLTENRLTFSTGRDLELVPKQTGEPLNFFVYPYVEVEGKAYPQEKIHGKFSFEDVLEKR